MQTLSEKEIIRRIRRQETFTANIDNGCFSIKVERYVPGVCTAIHAGHRVSDSLAGKMLLREPERKYEEDLFVGDMLASFPIVLQGLDSRYMYDLNRPPDDCIYEVAWGKKVWRKPLTEREWEKNIALHNSYYRVMDILLGDLVRKFSRCILYDLHSYNYKRIESETPLFNIGTHFIDLQAYRPVLDNLINRLLDVQLPEITNRVLLNAVFYGRGYQAAFIYRKHPNCLCLPLEVKKIYMDEASGEPYPLIVKIIAETLKRAISCNASYFARKYAGKRMQPSAFLSRKCVGDM